VRLVINDCLLLCFAILAFPCLPTAKGKTNSNKGVESVRSFVDEFYRWYVPKTLKPQSGPAWNLILKYRSTSLSPDLLQALKEDSDAQAKASGVIVGLDFDPFLNTQDPCEHYEVGEIVQKEQIYQASVLGVCSGKKNEKPDVIAQVEKRNGRWIFVNFAYPNLEKEYPNSANLLETLKALREERK
jgi:hypothetical protein